MSVKAVTVTVLTLEAIAFEMMEVVLVLAGGQVCRNMYFYSQNEIAQDQGIPKMR